MTSTAAADLITRAKKGDRSAFDQLIGPLVDQGFRLAYGMLHDREAAEDAVQEAAVRSWRKLGNLRPGTEMRPWFLAIVANQCRTTARGSWWNPRSHFSARPQDAQFPPRANGRLLNRVLCRLAVVEHPVRKPKSLVHQGPDQLVEGRPIAFLCPGDEVGGGR